MKHGNRRFWVIPVTKIEHERLAEYGKEWILQLWLQVFNEVENNLQLFRLSPSEREELEKNNLQFMEYLPGEEEILQKINFQTTVKWRWTSQELIQSLNLKITPQIFGKAINKIKDNYPDLIEIKRTNRGNAYYLPIKKV